jgi:hypothetical protein
MTCHPFRRPALVAAALALGFQFAADAGAAIQSVGVQKMLWYLQTSDRDVHINAQDTAYTFEAAVWGTALSGMTPPALAGPIDTALLGPSYTGRMTLGPANGTSSASIGITRTSTRASGAAPTRWWSTARRFR